MKMLSLLLFSCTFLIAGCCVESSITRDESVADDGTVLFYLTDGSYIKSSPEKHHRLEEGGGYGVAGIRVRNNQSKDKFEGCFDIPMLRGLLWNT